MEFEFDQEIDFLLRQTAQDEVAFAVKNPKSEIRNPKSAHLDADEIAAFAENALPEKTRLNYVAHLADCDRCRKFLSNLIVLNSAAQSEIIHAEGAKSLAAIRPEIPWYRKLFAVPNLAYAMGALVLLFSGIAVYTVLQSGAKDAQVSSVYEKQSGGKGMSSDGDASPAETFSSSNSALSNTAANTTTSRMANMSTNSASASNSTIVAAPTIAANSNSMPVRKEADKDLNLAAKPAATQNEPLDLPKTADSVAPAAAPPAPVKEDNSQNEDETARQQPNVAQQNQGTQNQTQIMPDSRNARRAQSDALRTENKAKKSEETSDDARENARATTSVGGKIFRRENSVWYDSAYRGQATTNVSRGTNEYKNLDKGLRQIVERIGGTVVVVWKEKAYRIQ